jgi:hypothetical protein
METVAVSSLLFLSLNHPIRAITFDAASSHPEGDTTQETSQMQLPWPSN